MNTLTAQIAATYWGAKVISFYDKKSTDKRIIGDMRGISGDCIFIENYNAFGVSWGTLSRGEFIDCQLLLTPLSKITDEDAIEVAKIADENVKYLKGNNHKATISEYKIVRSKSPDKEYVGVDRYSGSNYWGYEPLPQQATLFSIEQIDYLRSKSYDCGYGSIPSLIDAGIAIDKTITP